MTRRGHRCTGVRGRGRDSSGCGGVTVRGASVYDDSLRGGMGVRRGREGGGDTKRVGEIGDGGGNKNMWGESLRGASVMGGGNKNMRAEIVERCIGDGGFNSGRMFLSPRTRTCGRN